MPSINSEIISHRLNIHLKARLVKQKKKHIALERLRYLEEKVDKLLEIRFIREIQFPEWLANVVIVPKAIRKW